LYFVYYSYAIVCQFVSLYTMSYFIHQFLCCYSIADILGSLSGVRCYLSYNLLMCICIIFCEIFMLFEICYCCLSSLISISQTSCYNNTKIGEWNSSWYTSWQIGIQWHTSNRQNTIIRKNVHYLMKDIPEQQQSPQTSSLNHWTKLNQSRLVRSLTGLLSNLYSTAQSSVQDGHSY
jgi:hypothetical protein